MDAIIAAGAVRASRVPTESGGRADLEEVGGAELIEDAELRVHRADRGAPAPATLSFLDGIQRWIVRYYDGATPIVHAYVAAAIRRRGADRRLRTVTEAARELHVAPLGALQPAVRAALESSGIDLLDAADAQGAQPGRAIEAIRRVVENERVRMEKGIGERYAATLDRDEWLIVDGVLSESATLAAHPRALGVIKSHGAQYFEGAALTSVFTLAHGARTSVFRPRGRAHHDVFSWYLRLWPWEGNDASFGLVRVEARADQSTVASASGVSGWLVRERTPIASPDPRWDRLFYPIHDVETYLKARAPRGLVPAGAPLLPYPQPIE